MRAYREFIPAAAARAERVLRVPDRAAGPAVPGGAARPAGLRHRVVLHRRPEDAAKAMAPMLAVGTPLMHGVGRDASPGDAGRVRRALPAGRAVVLAGRLRPRAVRRGDRRARQVGQRSCRPGSRPCTCTRSTARCTTCPTPTRRSATATCTWAEVIVGVDPDPANARELTRLDDRLLGGHPPALRRRRLRQLHDGRRPGAREGDLSRQLRPAGTDQGRT